MSYDYGPLFVALAHDAGRSSGLPVHWPLEPAPLPPFVGGGAFANAAAAARSEACLRRGSQPFAVALCSPTTSTFQPDVAGENLVVRVKEGVYRFAVGRWLALRGFNRRPGNLHVLNDIAYS
jgi:hypothetical protein